MPERALEARAFTNIMLAYQGAQGLCVFLRFVLAPPLPAPHSPTHPRLTHPHPARMLTYELLFLSIHVFFVCEAYYMFGCSSHCEITIFFFLILTEVKFLFEIINCKNQRYKIRFTSFHSW